MSATIEVGAVQITSISDAFVPNYAVPLDQMFPAVPTDAWRPYRARYPSIFGNANTWNVDFGCYLVRSRDKTILIDTGIGPPSAPYAAFLHSAGQLPSRLTAEGVSPGDVDFVVATHLHPDHIGWSVIREDGANRLTFARARHIVHQADWDMFHTDAGRTSLPFPFVDEIVTPLADLGALDLITDEHAVTPDVTLLHTPGHTPGSVSVYIASQGESALIWGDVVSHPALVTERDWDFAFDLNPGLARTTREALLDRAETEGATIAACHFPDPGFGRIIRIDGRRYWHGI